LTRIVAIANGETQNGEIYIRHFVASGENYTCNKQYRDLRFWSEGNADYWSGTSVKYPDRTMVGRGGYTYFNPQTGIEFSSVLGFTYNLENPHTQYQNGVNLHLDIGTSRFVTKQLQIGLVGYAYQQISCDRGAGNRLGCFEARLFGVGPQIGYIVPMGHLQGYLNLKGYWEFDAEHRARGWNTWLTFAISPAAPSETPPGRRP
jgi:Putative MetA-pathway of phenol degradation